MRQNRLTSAEQRAAPPRDADLATGQDTVAADTTASKRPARAASRELRPFVLEVGRALSLAGTAVSETQDRLVRIAAANGAPNARIVALPTVLLVALGRARRATVEVIPQRTGALRLDQISALYEVVKRAERGEISPGTGLVELDTVQAMKPRFGAVTTIAGRVLMTVGLCLLLKPTVTDLAAATVFGLLIALLTLLGRGHRTLIALLPVIAAVIVSAATFVAINHEIAHIGVPALIAPLVTFLPGAALTTATVELASGEMVAGSSRLVFGALQLLLLAFGIVAGAELVGIPGAGALRTSYLDPLGSWAPWLGVVVFGVATALYFSAPRGALRWLMLVLAVAWLGQLLGDRLIGATASGFCGALAMTPVALGVARLRTGPPSQVTFLPGFWLLVPGALGLVGVTGLISNLTTAGFQSLVQPVASIVAIALGVLCGASIYHLAETGPDQLRAWRTAAGPTIDRVVPRSKSTGGRADQPEDSHRS